MNNRNAILKVRKGALILLLTLSSLIFARAQTEDRPFESPKTPVTCEETYTFINDAMRRYSVRQNKGSLLIIVFRSGAGESPPRLRLDRLLKVKRYVTEVRPKVDAIFAQGEAVSGYSLIEIYLEGSLLYSLPIARGRSVDLSTCVAA